MRRKGDALTLGERRILDHIVQATMEDRGIHGHALLSRGLGHKGSLYRSLGNLERLGYVESWVEQARYQLRRQYKATHKAARLYGLQEAS